MSNDLMLIFLIAISLFVMQAVGGVFQIKNYKAAIRRVHKKGNVGIGQKKGRFFNGNIVMIACDNNHIITACEVMDGKTFLAKFHPVNTLLGKTINGVSIDKFLEQFRSMDPKKTETVSRIYTGIGSAGATLSKCSRRTGDGHGRTSVMCRHGLIQGGSDVWTLYLILHKDSWRCFRQEEKPL